jgi:AraC-like DNA-binding protein
VLALDAGYHDQAHMSRDVQAFSAMSPGELRRRLLPEQGGVRED